jgi:hypothetical protein
VEELNAHVELDTSRDGFSSVIPSESHESVPNLGSEDYKLSKSLKCKAKNINQIQSFNELIRTKKPNAISFSKHNLEFLRDLKAITSPTQVLDRFLLVSQPMWFALKQWFGAEIEVVVYNLESTEGGQFLGSKMSSPV